MKLFPQALGIFVAICSLSSFAQDITFKFDQSTNLSSWKMWNIASRKQDNNGINIVTKHDPMLIISKTINADDINFVQITMKSDKAGLGQLFFTPAGKGFTEPASFRFKVKGNNQMETYLITCTNKFWKGTIQNLRFDPINPQGANITIKKIKLLNKTELKWTFNAANKFSGWSPNIFMKNIKYSEDCASFVSGRDPYVTSKPVKIKAELFTQAEITIKTDKDTYIQVFFAAPSKNFAQPTSVTSKLKASEDWQTIELNLTKNKLWTGLIGKLRLDPVGTSGCNVSIKSIILK